jgi:hypothetical protein
VSEVSAPNLVAARAQSFWRWWCGELSALVPLRLKTRTMRLVLVNQSDGQYRLLSETLRGGEITSVRARGKGPRPLAGWLPELTQFQSGLTRKMSSATRFEPGKSPVMSGQIGLRLSADEVLERHAAVPWQARERIGDVLGLEIERATPFLRDEVYWDHLAEGRPQPDGRVGVRQFLLQRTRIDAAIADLRELGFETGFVDCWDDGGRVPLAVNLLRSGRVEPPPARRGGAVVTVALAGLVLALGTMVVMADQDRYGRALTDVDVRLQAGGKEVAALRKAREAHELASQKVQALLERKRREAPVVEVVETLARRLPDGSWLTALHIESGKADLMGFSPSATALISMLQDAPATGAAAATPVRLKTARLTAPVTFDGSRKLEQFGLQVGFGTTVE